MALYAIGDIQGCYDCFQKLLDRLRFDPAQDELWLVGDLVNRGPHSLKVLRSVRALGSAVTCVLGNHDLHLLAAAAGRRRNVSPELAQVLKAKDADEHVAWLRRQPLLHYDAERELLLVHAGIPPQWRVKKAIKRGRAISRVLKSRDWRRLLKHMYGDSPNRWSPRLKERDRWRFTINALTRMRFCDAKGRLDFKHDGPPGSQPKQLMPWFDVPSRQSQGTHIVFGHWAALGLLLRSDISAVDTGCVWGRRLTALPLDPPGKPVQQRCH